MRQKMTDNHSADYWDDLAKVYQEETSISCDDFHYGPLIPGDCELGLLPESLNGLKCFEFAAGAAQNSIFLASQGAKCTASDVSSKQLKYADELCKRYQVEVNLQCLSMQEIKQAEGGPFDLVHSAYGLPFTDTPGKVIADCAAILKPGGILLFSIPHPIFSGEFLQIDDTTGIFMANYFNIPPETRHDNSGQEIESSNYYNLEQLSTWLIQSGFTIEAIKEPRPVQLPPYTSKVWEEYREQFNKFPGTLIIKAKLHPSP
jgi:2-polyprenyl-3-methyl-5-hydroxy-6-metoxy-1,4-benzoquinol methylase